MGNLAGKPVSLNALSRVLTGVDNCALDSSKLVNLYDHPLLIREAHFTVYGPNLAGVPALTVGAPLYSAFVYAQVATGLAKLIHSMSTPPIDAIPIRLLNTENPSIAQEVLQMSGNANPISGQPMGFNFARWAFDPPMVLDPGQGFHVNIVVPVAFTPPFGVVTETVQVEVAFVGEHLPAGDYPLYLPYVCAFVGAKGSAYQEAANKELANLLPDPITICDIVGTILDSSVQTPAGDFSDANGGGSHNDQTSVLATLIDPTSFIIAKNVPFTMLFDMNRRALKTRTVVPAQHRYSLTVTDNTTAVASHTPMAAIHGYRRAR